MKSSFCVLIGPLFAIQTVTRLISLSYTSTLNVYITHATDKHVDNLAKRETIIGFIKYSSLALIIFILGWVVTVYARRNVKL